MGTIQPANALTWSGDTQLTTDPDSDWSPAVTQTTDGRIWVLWHTYRTGNADIFTKIYDGTTWSPETPLTTDPEKDINPTIFQDRDGKIWVFWSHWEIDQYEIFFKFSSDNGVSWSDNFRLTWEFWFDDLRPSAMQTTDGTIWIVWYSGRTGNDELFYKTYNETWSADTQLTFNAYKDRHPSIFQDRDGKIWVFWSAWDTDNYEIFCKTTVDNGESWSEETQVTSKKNSWDMLPSAMQARDGKVWVVWEADRSGQDFDLYYKTYDGAWSSDINVASDPAEDTLPSIFQAANKTIWITWSSTRAVGDGDYDLYYLLASEEHDIGVTGVAPYSTYVQQDFGTQVQVNVSNYGLYGETFTVTVYADSTTIEAQTIFLASGATTTLTFNWDTTSVPYGYYIISATASAVPDEADLTDNSLTDGTVMVTVTGDVNGDRTVTISDSATISAHWYPGPPEGPLGYDPNADINDDGAVNIVDIGIVSFNWGSSW